MPIGQSRMYQSLKIAKDGVIIRKSLVHFVDVIKLKKIEHLPSK